MNIPARIFRPEDNAGALLTAGISTVDLILNVDDASRFPDSVFGTAEVVSGSLESNLNVTGIGAFQPNGRLIQVGDQIVNWTDGSYGYVESVSANFITTSCLKGGATNQWKELDEFSTLPFLININKKVLNGTTNLLEITQQELVMCRSRNGNIIRVEQRAFAAAGKVGSQAFPFASNDYVDLFQSAGHWHEMTKELAMLQSNKMELNEKRDATFSGTMDFQGSAVLTNLPANPTDPTAVTVNSQLNSITATQSFSLEIQHPLPFFNPVLTWNNIVASDPSFEYVVFRTFGPQREGRDGFITLAVLPSTQISYVDTAPSSFGVINYNGYAIGVRPTGATTGYRYTNSVSTRYDPAAAVPSGFYGNSSEGAYVPGTPIFRNRAYQFSSFVTNLPVVIEGDGTLPIVFVDGVIDLQVGADFTHTPSAVEDFTPSISFDISGPPPNVVADVSCGAQAGGTGGQGGLGGAGDGTCNVVGGRRIGGFGGTAGQNGMQGEGSPAFPTYQAGGVGGIAGINGNTSTGGGSGGGGGGDNGACGTGTPGAVGSTGGVISGYSTSIIFITSASPTIAAGVKFTLDGIDGGSGAAGTASLFNICAANCIFPFWSFSGIGGSSGGGGGGGGGDAPKVVFAISGGVITDNTNPGDLSFDGGLAGFGGAGGPNVVHPCVTSPPFGTCGNGGPGVAGLNGVPGNAGGIFTYNID